MLHGVIPDSLFGGVAPIAFLGPAWSISLEWQFYLIAPLAFKAAISQSKYVWVVACLGVLSLHFSTKFLPGNWVGSFLPFKIGFFYLGAFSYFVFAELRKTKTKLPGIAITLIVVAWIFYTAGNSRNLAPICIWICFFGIILEGPSEGPQSTLQAIFNNSIVAFIGKISFSLYLGHEIIITGSQYALFEWAPNITQDIHCLLLLLSTTTLGIGFAAILYKFIEKPGIELGRKISSALNEKIHRSRLSS